MGAAVGRRRFRKDAHQEGGEIPAQFDQKSRNPLPRDRKVALTLTGPDVVAKARTRTHSQNAHGAGR
jgi:hypothetical protein